MRGLANVCGGVVLVLLGVGGRAARAQETFPPLAASVAPPRVHALQLRLPVLIGSVGVGAASAPAQMIGAGARYRYQTERGVGLRFTGDGMWEVGKPPVVPGPPEFEASASYSVRGAVGAEMTWWGRGDTVLAAGVDAGLLLVRATEEVLGSTQIVASGTGEDKSTYTVGRHTLVMAEMRLEAVQWRQEWELETWGGRPLEIEITPVAFTVGVSPKSRAVYVSENALRRRDGVFGFTPSAAVGMRF